ncbi:flagellar protein FliO/FliZ [Diaminobutyricimonas aerilata]|uniref:Flagellar protein FliO/FliZ n=1 Tax=Diaminobutyricimonas aerilata TaxID=1162967 RepID=A0A2M9CMY4_9MICO|nr:flagellar biosynthetic protein FliO [Diaminobutyricimonas aerilata]PJJ73276.1 flagellar protein FliO/FliZ [Diaminobutyricimonas aerilata]
MDTIFLALRVLVSLAAVLAVIWYVQRRWARGRGAGHRKDIRVVSRQGVGSKASVAVVEVDGTRFLLGVTEQSVNVLNATPLQQPELQAVPTAPGFARILDLQQAQVSQSNAQHAAPVDPLRVEPSAAVTVLPTRRQVRSSLQRERAAGPFAGSILSPDTWRQAGAALRQAR